MFALSLYRKDSWQLIRPDLVVKTILDVITSKEFPKEKRKHCGGLFHESDGQGHRQLRHLAEHLAASGAPGSVPIRICKWAK